MATTGDALRIDAKLSPELLATLAAIRAVGKTLQKQIRDQTKRVAGPEWMKALAHHADTRLEHRVIVDTAAVSVSNQNVRMQSANKGRKLTGGLQPKRDFPAIDRGTNTDKTTTYQRKTKHGTHSVTRHTTRQFKPRRKGGYVFWQTAKEMVPRFGRLWVQTTVRTLANALEGKQE